MSAPAAEVVTVRRWTLALAGGREILVRSFEGAGGGLRTVWLGSGWSEDRDAVSTEGGVVIPGGSVRGLIEVLEALVADRGAP